MVKTRIMLAGVLLIIGAIAVHYITPGVISQVDLLTSPLQGNMVCGLANGMETQQSQVATPTDAVNLFFHNNICSALKTLETIFGLSSLGAGFVGTSLQFLAV